MGRSVRQWPFDCQRGNDMKTTIELLNCVRGCRSDSALANELGVTRAAISRARSQGRVSPDLAARLAELAEEEPIKWIAIAAVEQMNAAQQERWLGKVTALFAVAVVGVTLTVKSTSAYAKPLDRIQIMRNVPHRSSIHRVRTKRLLTVLSASRQACALQKQIDCAIVVRPQHPCFDQSIQIIP